MSTGCCLYFGQAAPRCGARGAGSNRIAVRPQAFTDSVTLLPALQRALVQIYVIGKPL
jgi:hypothetical protein